MREMELLYDCSDTSELWQTAAVRQRLNAHLFLTMTGSCYALEGAPDVVQMRHVLSEL